MPAFQRPIDRGAVALGLVVLVCVGCTRWLRLNVSGSVAYGLYRLAPVPPVLARGTLVVLAVPPSVQHVWSSWVPLLKPVAGLPGDRVCHQDNVLYVNGVSYGPVLHEAHGMPLPHIDNGCLVVQAGEVFLASPIAHSLDSRYFGPVPLAAIRAVAVPLVTWR